MFTLTDLKTILVDRIGIPEGDIPDDLATAFTDLGMDSLAIVEVQLAIQQEYGIKITRRRRKRPADIRRRARVRQRAPRPRQGGLSDGRQYRQRDHHRRPARACLEHDEPRRALAAAVHRIRRGRSPRSTGDRTKFRLTTHPDPEHDGQVWSWVSERTADPRTHTSHARRIETGPFEFMHIDWSFAAVDGGTEMRWRQHFAMKPDAPADDAGAEDYLNRNTQIQMQVIKERLETART